MTSGGGVFPTNAQVAWKERVCREAQPDEESSEGFTLNVRSSVGDRPTPDGYCPWLFIDLGVESTGNDTVSRYSLDVAFQFADQTALSDEAAERFLKESGLEYALGFIRGAMLDGLRMLGRPTVLLPMLRREDMDSFVRVQRENSDESH